MRGRYRVRIWHHGIVALVLLIAAQRRDLFSRRRAAAMISACAWRSRVALRLARQHSSRACAGCAAHPGLGCAHGRDLWPAKLSTPATGVPDSTSTGVCSRSPRHRIRCAALRVVRRCRLGTEPIEAIEARRAAGGISARWTLCGGQVAVAHARRRRACSFERSTTLATLYVASIRSVLLVRLDVPRQRGAMHQRALFERVAGDVRASLMSHTLHYRSDARQWVDPDVSGGRKRAPARATAELSYRNVITPTGSATYGTRFAGRARFR